MDNTLKQLLDAELRAQKLVDRAFAERDALTAQARNEAKAAEQRFEKRISEIHESFMNKSEQRANQTIAELQRREQEKRSELQNMAQERMRDAVHAAIEILLGTESD